MRAPKGLTLGKGRGATWVGGFAGLLRGGSGRCRGGAPGPGEVRTAGGAVLFTAADIRGGQAIYQKHGLMDWGSVLGHGTYFGPDFTAEILHRRVLLLRDAGARERGAADYAALDEGGKAAVAAAVKAAVKANGYDPAADALVVSEDEAAAFETIAAETKARFEKGEPLRGLPARTLKSDTSGGGDAWIPAGDPARPLAAFFWWTSWIAGAERPEGGTTYTNNWPFDPDAGNVASSGAMLWSGVSVAGLLLLLPLVLLFWHRGKVQMEDAYEPGRFPDFDLRWLPVFPSQRKAIKFFVAAAGLFLLQTLLGGYMAHSYVEGTSFYGLDLGSVLPFCVAKTWHLQLAVFWIAAAWMGLGIYVAPLVGGRDPKGQGLLVDVLFWAVVAVVLGSMAGEWLGVQGMLGTWWWWLGHSGWEIVELGKLWQIALAAGFALWIVILVRALRDALREEKDRGGLVHLFVTTAVAIPALFGAAFLITPGTHLTMADYWRWWIIHLWVEGMFEVFTVVALGLMLVQMKLVTPSSTARALKFQLIILLGSGIIGTGHHYYWIGATEMWIALGSVFSALEVIPLTLLAIEAVEQWVVIRRGGARFPYKHTFMFLAAVAAWNLFGAGVLGFLINLPAVSYYEHGSFLTANHGHGALMGVFGMMAIALALYCARNTTREDAWSDRLFTLSFWGLNAGLLGMIVLTLTPVGVMQLVEAAENGFWSARSLEFYRQASVQRLLWLRILPDAVFIGLGVVPLCIGLVRAWRNMRPATPIEVVPAAVRRADAALAG